MFRVLRGAFFFLCLVLICEEKKNWRNWVQRGGGYRS